MIWYDSRRKRKHKDYLDKPVSSRVSGSFFLSRPPGMKEGPHVLDNARTRPRSLANDKNPRK
jgi:hypothetical protein